MKQGTARPTFMLRSSGDIRWRPGPNHLALLAQLRDAESHHIAGLEIDRLGLHTHADAGRGARRDEVAGQQRDEAAHIADQMGRAENHRPRIARLPALAVEVEPHIERLYIAHLIGGDEPGAGGPEGIGALALVPGAATLDLPLALRDVIDDAEARDVLQGLGLRHMLALAADDDAEFDFPIRFHGILGDDDLVIRA